MVDPWSHSSYHSRLPYGEQVSAEPLVGHPFFPFEGELRIVPLAEPVVPEPPRAGEQGGEDCFLCAQPDAAVIWRDPNWSVRAGLDKTGIPLVALLAPVRHMTLRTMEPEVEVSLGPMIRRLTVAMDDLPGVGRTHFSRLGDGSAHFHMHFLTRPLGMMQMRGPMLAAWNDLLPAVPEEEVHAGGRQVAVALAEHGGEAVGAGRTD